MEKRWGLLERSPQTPKNFSRICYKIEPVPPGFILGDARGGEALGGFLKEAPKPQELFWKFLLTATGVLRRHQKNRFLKVEPVPPGFSPRGCKGRSPLHKKTKISPFPPGRSLCERGSGGWGQGSTLKAGSAGDKRGALSQPASPGVLPPPHRKIQGKSVAARISEKALDKCPKVWYNTTCYGGIAQLVRAPR